MKKTSMILLGLVIISVGLSIVRIALSAAFSTSGIDLNRLQVEKANIQKENMLMREVVYTQASLAHIDSLATHEGFVESDRNSRYVLGNPSTVALKP